MPKYRIVVTFTTLEEAVDGDEAVELGMQLLKEGYWEADEAEITAELEGVPDD